MKTANFIKQYLNELFLAFVILNLFDNLVNIVMSRPGTPDGGQSAVSPPAQKFKLRSYHVELVET